MPATPEQYQTRDELRVAFDAVETRRAAALTAYQDAYLAWKTTHRNIAAFEAQVAQGFLASNPDFLALRRSETHAPLAECEATLATTEAALIQAEAEYDIAHAALLDADATIAATEAATAGPLHQVGHTATIGIEVAGTTERPT